MGQKRRADFWNAHIEAWRESGGTQRAYCQRKGLCEIQFSQWKRRLDTERAQQRVGAQLVPLTVIEETSVQGKGSSARDLDYASAQSDLALVFGNGLRLEIGNGFSSAALSRVLEVLDDVG